MASATILARSKSDILLGWFCFLRRRQKRRTAALSGNPCSSVSSLGSCKALSSGRSGAGGDSGVEEDGGDSVPVSGAEEEDGGDSVPASDDEEEDAGDPVPIPVLVEEEEEGDWDLGGEEDGDAIILTLE